MRFGSAIAVVLLAASTAQAQPGADSFQKELDALFVSGGLTADAAAKRAIRESPQVRRESASIDVSVETALAAELVRVPRVGVAATYTRLSPIDSIPFGMGAALNFPVNSYGVVADVGLQLSDYVWRYPKLVKGARLGVETARLGKRVSEIDAAYEARLAYYEWVRAKLQVMVARRTLEQTRTTLRQVRALADAQRVSKADLMRIEAGEATAEQVLDQLANLEFLREEQLRLLIGADRTREPLAIGEDMRVEVTPPPDENLDELMRIAQRMRYEFRTIDTGIEAKKSQRDAEKAGQFPRLSAFGTLEYAKPNQRVFLDPDNFNLTWAAGLQLTWSINETLVTRSNTRRFDAEVRVLEADRENLERGTRIQVLAAQQAVDLAVKSLATSRKGLAAAEESYRVRQALLAADRATAVELVDAETELTRARIAALNARIDLRVAMTQLSHATGGDTK